MGLGKSLSTLALICSSLDLLNSDDVGLKEGGARATLIVTPKSSRLTIPVCRMDLRLYGSKQNMDFIVQSC